MRALPGMLVCCPCDGHEMRLAVEALINYNGPAYLRLARPATEIITDEIPGYSFGSSARALFSATARTSR